MGILLDTDILIDIARGREQALRFLQSLQGEVVAVSHLSVAELLVGARTVRERDVVEKFVKTFVILAPDAMVSERALALIKTYHHVCGTGIIDAYIAATAIEFDMTLCSRNAKHFSPIRELSMNIPYTLT